MQFNNPFQWCVIQPEDMMTLMQEWSSIDFNNYQLLQGDILGHHHYYTLIDNKVKVWWVYYFKDDNCIEKKIVHDEDNGNANLFYKDIENYINQCYERRLRRMGYTRPTFVLNQDVFWKFSDVDIAKTLIKYHNTNNVFVVTYNEFLSQIFSNENISIKNVSYVKDYIELAIDTLQTNLDDFSLVTSNSLVVIPKKKDDEFRDKPSEEMQSAIFCMAKCENKYLRDWVEYHLKLGFNHLYINDNNDIDGEIIADVINDYIESGVVSVIDKRGKVKKRVGDTGLQEECMEECYRLYSHLYDWIAIVDIDEYITLDEKFPSINDYLSQPKFHDSDCIKLKEQVMTDNGQLYYVQEPVYKRFTQSATVSLGRKSFFRSGIKDFKLSSGTHSSADLNLQSCNSKGEYLRYNYRNLQHNELLTYDECYYKHFAFNTVEEFFSERIFKRGDVGDDDSIIKNRINSFFEYNEKTPEKEVLFEQYLEQYNDLKRKKKQSLIEQMKARIFILGYKQFDCPVHNKDLYSIVNLKAKRSIRNTTKHHYDVPIIYTDKGDSISDRNDIYDEWTGIYWLWKNYDFSNLDYVGLCQYRRYFEFLDEPAFDILKDYDLTTGGFVESQNNNTVNFRLYHNLDDLKALGRYITDPEDIRHTVSFLSSNVFYPSNILFMKKELFFEFCEFVFGYIFKYQEGEGLTTIEAIESRILQNPDAYPANGRTPEENVKYQRQLVAFLMERLTNIWITKYNETHNIMRVSCIETEHTGQGIFKYQPVENK